MESKRFFRADDHGARYWVVDSDLDSAKKRLDEAGVEFESPKWTEMSVEEANKVTCNTDEDARERGRIPLTACDIGEWFSTEF